MTSSRPVRPTERELSITTVWREQNPGKDYREWQRGGMGFKDGSWDAAKQGTVQKLLDYEERLCAWNETHPELAQMYQDVRELYTSMDAKNNTLDEIMRLEHRIARLPYELEQLKEELEEKRGCAAEAQERIDLLKSRHADSPHAETFKNPPAAWVEDLADRL